MFVFISFPQKKKRKQSPLFFEGKLNGLYDLFLRTTSVSLATDEREQFFWEDQFVWFSACFLSFLNLSLSYQTAIFSLSLSAFYNWYSPIHSSLYQYDYSQKFFSFSTSQREKNFKRLLFRILHSAEEAHAEKLLALNSHSTCKLCSSFNSHSLQPTTY